MQSRQRWLLSIVLGMALGFGVTSACRSSSSTWWGSSEIPWQRSSGRSSMILTNGKTLAVAWDGEIAVSDDETHFMSVSEGGHAEVYAKEGGRARSVLVTSSAGELRREYRDEGVLLADVPEWGDALEARGIQATTIGAKERARSVLAVEGSSGLLDQVGRATSEGRARAYLDILVAEGDLDGIDPERLIDVAFEHYSSNSDRGEVLVGLAPRMVPDTGRRGAYFDACARISSSSTQCEVIEASVAHLGLDDGARVDACRAVERMSSSSDKVDCLLAIQESGSLEGPWLEAWCRAVEGIGSSSSMSECLEAAMKRPNLSDGTRVRLIRSTRSVSSNSSRSELLEQSLARKPVSSTVVEAVLVEAEGLSSSNRTRDLLMTVLDLPALDRNTLDRITEVAESSVTSTSDRVEVLERIVERMPR